MDIVTLIFIIIVSIILLAVVTMRMTGYGLDSLYGSFKRRSLLVKILIVIIAIPIFLYACMILFGYPIAEYNSYLDGQAEGKDNHYNDLINSAQASIDDESYDYALSTLNQALAFTSNDSQIYEMEAEVLYEQGNLDAALVDIIKGISLDDDPSYTHPYKLQAYILDSLGRYDEAADSFQKAIQYDPRNYVLYGELAEDQNISSQYDQALASINVYIGYNKDDVGAYIDRGISYYWLNQCEEALANFQYAYTLMPDNSYLSDYVSSTTLQLFTNVLQDIGKKYAQSDDCTDMIE